MYEPPVVSAEIALPPVAATNLPTVIAGLVSDDFDPSVTSLAVIVLVPSVARVTDNDLVPATSAVLAGRVALESLEAR